MTGESLKSQLIFPISLSFHLDNIPNFEVPCPFSGPFHSYPEVLWTSESSCISFFLKYDLSFGVFTFISKIILPCIQHYKMWYENAIYVYIISWSPKGTRGLFWAFSEALKWLPTSLQRGALVPPLTPGPIKVDRVSFVKVKRWKRSGRRREGGGGEERGEMRGGKEEGEGEEESSCKMPGR